VTRQNENDQQWARRVIPGVREHEAAQRLAARDEPGVHFFNFVFLNEKIYLLIRKIKKFF
jgi:hypothetical protein